MQPFAHSPRVSVTADEQRLDFVLMLQISGIGEVIPLLLTITSLLKALRSDNSFNMPRTLVREETFDREMTLPESQKILFDDLLACRAQSFINDEETRQLMQASRLSSTSTHHKKFLGGFTKWIIYVSFTLLLCAALCAIVARAAWYEPEIWRKVEEMMKDVELDKLGTYAVSTLELVKTVEPFLNQLGQIIEAARFIRRICSGVKS